MKLLSFLTVLITGLLTLIFYSVINYVLFKDFGLVPAGRIIFTSDFGYLDYLMLPLGLCMGTILLRRKQNIRSFKHLFLFNFKTTLLAAVLFSALIFGYLEFINADYFPQLIDLIKQSDIAGTELTTLKKEMVTRAAIIEKTQLFRESWFYGIANFFAYLAIGTVSSLLIAANVTPRIKRPEVSVSP